jgi:hypothetical protein
VLPVLFGPLQLQMHKLQIQVAGHETELNFFTKINSSVLNKNLWWFLNFFKDAFLIGHCISKVTTY